MNEQEKKIVRLLLNEMAFEGALRHFNEPSPNVPVGLYAELQQIGVPGRYDGSRETYVFEDLGYDENKSPFENCYIGLRRIRNNIIHANKAFKPDPPERLANLLSWADKFITVVYATNASFAARATEIKVALRVTSF